MGPIPLLWTSIWRYSQCEWIHTPWLYPGYEIFILKQTFLSQNKTSSPHRQSTKRLPCPQPLEPIPSFYPFSLLVTFWLIPMMFFRAASKNHYSQFPWFLWLSLFSNSDFRLFFPIYYLILERSLWLSSPETHDFIRRKLIVWCCLAIWIEDIIQTF